MPTGAESRVIPAAHFVVFDCTMNTIGATWREAYEQWLPKLNHVLDSGAVDFEYYPPNGGEGDMRVEIYIPVK